MEVPQLRQIPNLPQTSEALLKTAEEEIRFVKNPITQSYEHINKPPIDRRIEEIKKEADPKLFKLDNDTAEDEKERERLRQKKEDEKRRKKLLAELKALEKERLDRIKLADKDTTNLLGMVHKLTNALNKLRGIFK